MTEKKAQTLAEINKRLEQINNELSKIQGHTPRRANLQEEQARLLSIKGKKFTNKPKA